MRFVAGLIIGCRRAVRRCPRTPRRDDSRGAVPPATRPRRARVTRRRYQRRVARRARPLALRRHRDLSTARTGRLERDAVHRRSTALQARASAAVPHAPTTRRRAPAIIRCEDGSCRRHAGRWHARPAAFAPRGPPAPRCCGPKSELISRNGVCITHPARRRFGIQPRAGLHAVQLRTQRIDRGPVTCCAPRAGAAIRLEDHGCPVRR